MQPPTPPEAADDLISRGLLRKVFWGCMLGVLVYAALPLYADARTVFAGLAEVSGATLRASVALAVGNFVVRFARWEYYLRRLGIRVPSGESVQVFLSGFAMSITPGKLGEVLKSMMLRDARDIPLARSAPVVVAERVTDVAGLLLLGAFGAMGLPGGPWIVVIAVAGVVFLAAAGRSRALGRWLIGVASGKGRRAHLERRLLESHASIRDLMAPSVFVLSTVLSVIAWGLQGLCLAEVANAYAGVTLSLPHAMLAYCAPLLAGALSMIPGGLGLTEGGMAGVITHLGGAGATPAIAATITIVVRASTFWLAIAIGFAALGAWQLRHKR